MPGDSDRDGGFTVAGVVAGWVAGYAMAMLTTAALTFLATRERAGSFVGRWISEEIPVGLVTVPVSIGSIVGWTIIGLVAGSAYQAGEMEAQPGALGSPSWPFSVGMAILALFPLIPLTALASRYWWLWVVLSASFAGLFGWLMPVLAAR